MRNKDKASVITAKCTRLLLTVAVLLFGLAVSIPVQAFTVNVVDQDGSPVTGFKWLLEQDNTHDPLPGVHVRPGFPDVNVGAIDAVTSAPVSEATLSLNFHRSHAMVVANGESPGSSVVIDTTAAGVTPIPPGRYFVSVVPYGTADTTYDMGGTKVTVVDNTETVTVCVRENPIETAQISVQVFHDVAPLNNAWDPTEPGLKDFTITLMDQAGDEVTDAFGNKMGTTYVEGGCTTFYYNTTFCDDDGDGAPDVLAEGPGDFVTTCAQPDCMGPYDGVVLIKNLASNKYAIQVEPPAGQEGWRQVTTIEGTKTIDAWVRPNEPPFLAEFGGPGFHAFYGFVKEMDLLSLYPPGPKTTVTGQARKGREDRPPSVAELPGVPPSTSPCLIGLNTLQQGVVDEVKWVSKCEDDGFFTIPGVPPGEWQLVVWDVFLDQIIYFQTIIAGPTGGLIDLGQVVVPMWFGEMEHNVFSDLDRDGVWDVGEPGIPEQNINLRFRDGTINQAFPTDLGGFVPFEEVFPFFNWQVAEVDFATLRATGATFINDLGGTPDFTFYGEGKRNPDSYTEVGPVLTQAYQIFPGMNLRIDWGKAPYDADVNFVDTTTEADYFASTLGWPGGTDDDDTSFDTSPDGVYQNNGGISGIVFYAVTRAEDDPRFAAGEEWESGIPRVQVNLYRDIWCSSTPDTLAIYPICPEAIPGEIGDGIPDDKNGNTVVDYTPDVDNYPLGFGDCRDENNTGLGTDEDGAPCAPGVAGPEDFDADSDGLLDLGDAIRVAWTDSWDDNLPTICVGDDGSGTPADPGQGMVIHGQFVSTSNCADGLRTFNQLRPGVFDGGYAFGPEDPLLVPGTYIVEAKAPPGYDHIKEEDRNVDFGNVPIPAISPPRCVGNAHEVPLYMSFATRADGTLLPWADPVEHAAPFAGDQVPNSGDERPLCDRKRVDLGGAQNAAADFFLFTDVPKAARAVGLITDDTANNQVPLRPDFPEKFQPAWMPIAVFDYTGKEITGSYADEFGRYNFLVPASYDINLPSPSGVGPKMHQVCLNTPTLGGSDDPHYDERYSTTCYTLNFESARTTYLDTPVIRTGAFVGTLQQTLACDYEPGVPNIKMVDTSVSIGPYCAGACEFTIYSYGMETVANPDYPGDNVINATGAPGSDGFPDDPPTEPETILVDYGFGGTAGMVTVDGVPIPLTAVAWGNDEITVTLNEGDLADGVYQLMVEKADGTLSQQGISLHVGGPAPSYEVTEGGPDSIQDAIDGTPQGGLVIVGPGTYEELVILNKRIRLQGAGAGVTILDAKQYSANGVNPLAVWEENLLGYIDAGTIGLVGNEATLFQNIPPTFWDGAGAGFFVAPTEPAGPGEVNSNKLRIDGFNIEHADVGGAIYVNAYANRMDITNNRLNNNLSKLGGGIRVGNPTVGNALFSTVVTDGSSNPEVVISHNFISRSASVGRGGGGVTIFKGADDYEITGNRFCGNFSREGGAGIRIQGLSDGGVIDGNAILFNEQFQDKEIGFGGGGLLAQGDPDPAGGLTEGTGDITVEHNLIQGNLAGSWDGGGAAFYFVNGQDVSENMNPNQWYKVEFNRNIVVNNVTALAGGGLAIKDAVNVDIERNTIAHNDSSGTAIAAFLSGRNNPSTPQPAGIVLRQTTPALAALTMEDFTLPGSFGRNIVWENRSFNWDQATAPDLVPNMAPWVFDDYSDELDGECSPQCFETGDGDPFPNVPGEYFNVLTTAAAPDEAGNFVEVLYTPLGQVGDYTDNVTAGP